MFRLIQCVYYFGLFTTHVHRLESIKKANLKFGRGLGGGGYHTVNIFFDTIYVFFLIDVFKFA